MTRLGVARQAGGLQLVQVVTEGEAGPAPRPALLRRYLVIYISTEWISTYLVIYLAVARVNVGRRPLGQSPQSLRLALLEGDRVSELQVRGAVLMQCW